MTNHDPIAYTYEADTHCPACAFERFGRNERGFIAESPTVDNEGNPIGAVFSWDEYDEGLYCGDCHGTIREPFVEAK